jgi:hypothetical protein
MVVIRSGQTWRAGANVLYPSHVAGGSDQIIRGEMARRIALIGHSGAGKSACLRELHSRGVIYVDPAAADMDALRWPLSKNEGQALETVQKALVWLTAASRPQVVAVRNDEMMLNALVRAKRERSDADEFCGLYFLYLQKPIPELQKHLKERSDCAAKEYTMKSYWRFHRDIFKLLADGVIVCGRRTTAEVTDRICALLNDPDPTTGLEPKAKMLKPPNL